ncbi:MAG: hypothetical protein WAU36_13290 [Cyclobacteriaceae bacterium]
MKSYLFVQVLLVSFFFSCYNDKDYDSINVNIDNVLKIQPYKTTVFANGRDTVILKVELPTEAADNLSQVTFSTTRGSFVESDKKEYQASAKLVKINGENKRIALAKFKSDISVGTAYIKIAILDFEKNIEIETQRNYASSVEVIPATFAINAGAFTELEIVTKLRSDNGQVSKGQKVMVAAFDDGNSPIGRFRVKNDLSNENEECSFIYSLVPDTLFKGKLIITATAIGSPSTTSGSTEIFVIK